MGSENSTKILFYKKFYRIIGGNGFYCLHVSRVGFDTEVVALNHDHVGPHSTKHLDNSWIFQSESLIFSIPCKKEEIDNLLHSGRISSNNFTNIK
jgi:hypothetical protein